MSTPKRPRRRGEIRIIAHHKPDLECQELALRYLLGWPIPARLRAAQRRAFAPLAPTPTEQEPR